MRKTGKCILSFILALSILFSFIPQASFATTENRTSSNGGTTSTGTADTIYVNPKATDNDGNGTSESTAVKTFDKAMDLVNAGGTIKVMGDLGHNIKNINKPVTIEGNGGTRVSISGGVTLPTVNGTVTFKNLSFNGASTFGAYGSSDSYKNLDLVIDDCAFTQASGNCVYIVPEINSLTVTYCNFTAVAPTSSASQKQYLIWPYQAKIIKIQHNTFDGNGIRGAIHLGDGHPEGTTATISDNIINGFERGVQLAFTTTGVQNTVKITDNKFENISLSQITESEPYEVATVFIHENLNNNTKVSYNGNKLTGTSQTMFYSENKTLSPDSIIKSDSFTGNTINDTPINTPADSWRDPWVAQVGNTKYKTLDEAITDAKSGNEPLELLSDVSIGTWNQIWNVDGLTIKGNNHTITIDKVESGSNGNYLFYGAKDLNVSDVTINFSTNGNGFNMISGTLNNVKMVGSDSSSYAVFVGSSSEGNNKVTLNNCTFENFDIAVYSQPAGTDSNKTSDIVVNGSTFNKCNMTMCSYAPNTTFTNNTVNGGSEISFAGAAENADRDNTYTITGNTFQNAGKIWFYGADLGNVTFVKNKMLGNSVVSTDQAQSGTNLNVSKNYWGGDAPGDGQLSGSNIVGNDEYYQQSSMNEEDLNTYVPPYTGKYSYEINVAKADNGSVSVDKYATEGDKVTITVTPDKAYKLDELSVTAGGKDVELTDNGDGTYSFTMPSSKVQITATFVEDEDYVEPTPEPTPEPSMPFTDVSENDWFYGAVQYVYDNDMMNGVSANSFAPNSNLTRAMMAAVLYNLEDQPTQADSSFTDVADGSWYADAVNWAAANNIVSGYGDGIFGPNDNITREQMASILYRYAEYKGYDVSAVGDLGQFNDADSVSEWANDVMSWAVGAGLINGMGDGSVAPQGTATRAQVATVLMNFCENIAK
ncbi:MAG: S-layer homology domain-containing protein [Peptococcaceae bacterium]|nr:S-layer homology domain-containing protein [Peptococcaceae bacterium]